MNLIKPIKIELKSKKSFNFQKNKVDLSIFDKNNTQYVVENRLN